MYPLLKLGRIAKVMSLGVCVVAADKRNSVKISTSILIVE